MTDLSLYTQPPITQLIPCPSNSPAQHFPRWRVSGADRVSEFMHLHPPSTQSPGLQNISRQGIICLTKHIPQELVQVIGFKNSSCSTFLPTRPCLAILCDDYKWSCEHEI